MLDLIDLIILGMIGLCVFGHLIIVIADFISLAVRGKHILR